ncbi:MAG: 30S ribosomal protein S4 [Patescibacteria group bacterium]|nr:30S ribosomal protein S4 [Patescibacteria group bacterium]
MSRYIGPRHKLCRRLGVKICDAAKCPLMRRNYPPGMHGPMGHGRLTAYGEQFREKQRTRHTYGCSERQFSNYYRKAVGQSGDSGINLATMLEMRLDNVVYRLHWAKTRPQARQMVSHGFITVNGKRMDIPSYETKTKDAIAVKQNKLGKKIFFELAARREKQGIPDWLNVQRDALQAKVIGQPAPESLKGLFNAQAVIELYSR